MPAYPSGTVEQQVLQQYSYLFQMAQQLNLTLEAAESSRTAAVQAAGKSRAAQGTEQEYQNLKSLIIKTADTVQRRMDQLRPNSGATLRSSRPISRRIRTR